MRRFRFVGDPSRYFYFNPVNGLVYDEDAMNGKKSILETAKIYPQDWEEVIDVKSNDNPIPIRIIDSKGDVFDILKNQTANIEIKVIEDGSFYVTSFEIK